MNLYTIEVMLCLCTRVYCRCMEKKTLLIKTIAKIAYSTFRGNLFYLEFLIVCIARVVLSVKHSCTSYFCRKCVNVLHHKSIEVNVGSTNKPLPQYFINLIELSKIF